MFHTDICIHVYAHTAVNIHNGKEYLTNPLFGSIDQSLIKSSQMLVYLKSPRLY